jgi:hypothetical protein
VKTPDGEAFALVNPENDGTVLNRLCSAYMAMLEGSEHGEKKGDKSLFRSFILESFGEISSKYHCDEVHFYLESRNGKIEISALPAS